MPTVLAQSHKGVTKVSRDDQLDWPIKVCGNFDHDGLAGKLGAAKHPEYVVQKETAQQNEASRERVELDKHDTLDSKAYSNHIR